MFIVTLKFSANKARAREFMAGHNDWIRRGFDDGVFLLTGSLQPNLGGGIIAHNTSLPDLQARVNDDPFVVEGGHPVDDAAYVVDLLVAVGTVVLTVGLYVVIPKGFFPVQDTGLIQAVTEGPQSVSFAAMSQRQRALAEAILEDPDVESLTSFVGVDGTNPTLNSGRMLINLKPREARTAFTGRLASTAESTAPTMSPP